MSDEETNKAAVRRYFDEVYVRGNIEFVREVFVPGSLLAGADESNARTVKVGVYEVHDKACGGDPDVMHRLFDLEIDLKTGAAKWDNDFPDMEMRPVPQRAR